MGRRMASRRRPRPVEAADCQILPFEQSTKRRRCAAAAASSPWCLLHEDLVARIAERVLAGDLLDYVRFRAVCPHWRSSTVDPRGRGVSDPRFHPHRWTMLPEGHGLHPGHTKLRGQVRFFNRDTGAFVRAAIPELKDHFILDNPDGLLLLQRDSDTAVRLLHPFTGDICEFPPLTSLIPQLDHLTGHRPRLDLDEHKVQSFCRIFSAVAVAVAPATGTVTVLLFHEHICRFSHASPGDRSWKLTSWSMNSAARTVGLRGSLYLACWGSFPEDSSIMRLDPPSSSSPSLLPPPQTIATVPSKLMILPHLVECDSEILVVGSTDMSRSHLVTVRLADLLLSGDGEPAVPVPLTSIGDHCLLFGMGSLSVSSRGLPSVAGNSIIHCSSVRHDRLMQYNLGDGGTLLPACDGDIVRTPPPSPHSIVHHLITCCYRYFWNKGLIYCARTKPAWGTKRKWRLGA